MQGEARRSYLIPLLYGYSSIYYLLMLYVEPIVNRSASMVLPILHYADNDFF